MNDILFTIFVFYIFANIIYALTSESYWNLILDYDCFRIKNLIMFLFILPTIVYFIFKIDKKISENDFLNKPIRRKRKE